MKVKEESEKAGLKLNIQKTKITAPGSITSWEIDGETVEQCQTLFWGFPCGSAGKESVCSMGDVGSIPGLGRPWEMPNCWEHHVKCQAG